MTEVQKRQLVDMRAKGYSYADISKTIGISDSTVRSFCRRNKADATSSMCKHCGKPFKVIPGRKPRLFCSDKCRTLWWNGHPECVNRNAIYDFVCAACGKSFSAYGNAHRKYCSHACYLSDRFGKDGDSDE